MKNIKFILVVLIIQLGFSCSAKNYIKYYKYIYIATNLYYTGNLDSSNYYYKQAYLHYPNKKSFPNSFDILRAGIKLHDDKLKEKAMKIIANTTTLESFIRIITKYNPEIIEILKDTSKYKFTDTEIKFIPEEEMVYTGIDSIIKTWEIEDQRVRNDKAISSGEWQRVDSINYFQLYSLFKNKQYPNKEFSFPLVVLLTHIDDADRFDSLKKYLLWHLKHGNYAPDHYAYSQDRSLKYSNKQFKYYWVFKGMIDKEPNTIEINIINKERKKIGLPKYPFHSGYTIRLK